MRTTLSEAMNKGGAAVTPWAFTPSSEKKGGLWPSDDEVRGRGEAHLATRGGWSKCVIRGDPEAENA
jgi:hypothetical protein